MKRATLELIQVAVQHMLERGQIDIADAGKQLVLVALDFIEAGELLQAREVIATCHIDYVTECLPTQRRVDRHFDRQVSAVEAALSDLRYMRKLAARA